MMAFRNRMQDEFNMQVSSLKVAMVPERKVDLDDDETREAFLDMLEALEEVYVASMRFVRGSYRVPYLSLPVVCCRSFSPFSDDVQEVFHNANITEEDDGE